MTQDEAVQIISEKILERKKLFNRWPTQITIDYILFDAAFPTPAEAASPYVTVQGRAVLCIRST